MRRFGLAPIGAVAGLVACVTNLVWTRVTDDSPLSLTCMWFSLVLGVLGPGFATGVVNPLLAELAPPGQMGAVRHRDRPRRHVLSLSLL